MISKALANRLGGSVRLNSCILTLLILLAAAIAQPLWAQAPPLTWTTNLGARLFAVDGQTNVYANVGGKVIQSTALGVPTQTNTICPVDGIARRDAAGNFYFGGNFDGTQNFGGITLVGGWLGLARWQAQIA